MFGDKRSFETASTTGIYANLAKTAPNQITLNTPTKNNSTYGAVMKEVNATTYQKYGTIVHYYIGWKADLPAKKN